MSQKRVRSVNWDEEEKQLLKEVMKEYAHIIENKCLRTNTNKEKIKAWAAVHQSFNELNSRPRELKQLQIQWKSMKISAKACFTKYKTQLKQTGGGPKPPSPSNEDVTMLNLLNPGEFIEDENLYDSDAMQIVKPIDSTVEEGQQSEANTMEENNITLHEVFVSVDEQENQDNMIDTNILTLDHTQHGASSLLLSPLIMEEQIDCSLFSTPKPGTMSKISPRLEPKTKGSMGHDSRARKKLRSTKQNENNYAHALIAHSKQLKDAEHRKHMEMAEEEHQLKIKFLNEEHLAKMIEQDIKIKIEKEKLKKIKLCVNRIKLLRRRK